jgi:hypothetical protein
MTDKEVMQQALEALTIYSDAQCSLKGLGAITALRTALEQPEQEPVAWMSVSGDWVTRSKPVMENHASKGTVFVPLYK